MNNRLLNAAVIIPLLGLLGLTLRAEIARIEPAWTFPIEGYDPRDLVHGHYLRYSYQLNWDGPHQCDSGGSGMGERDEDEDCCVCINSSGNGRQDPIVSAFRCSEVAECDAWLQLGEVTGPHRYLVPEEHAHELEVALRSRSAAVEVTCGRTGEAHVGELFVDGRPWRDALSR